MLLRLNRFSVVDLRHPSHPPASKPRVLIAVPPTINCALDETPLSPQRRVELC